MNTGVGDAIDLSWKLAAVACKAGAARKLLRSYEIERRQIGDRNVASVALCVARAGANGGLNSGPTSGTIRPPGAETRANLARVADIEQRKTNEMIGAELGYRYKQFAVDLRRGRGPR